MAKLMASAVADSRLGVFDSLGRNQFDNIDLSPIMVGLVDVVSVEALDYLATQLDVDGFKGYDYCVTEEKKRELLRRALNLHRKIGTVSAIKKACALAGFTPELVEENAPINGTRVWCAFSIKVSPSDLSVFKSDTMIKLKSFIEYYKNARSILTEIYIGMNQEDTIFQASEELRDKLELKSNITTDGDYNTDYSFDYL